MPEAKTHRTPAFIAAALAVALGGCSTDLSAISSVNLNPFKGEDPLRSADYNYFYRRDQRSVGAVSAADLVGPDGRCAFEAAPYPAASPAAPPQAAPAAAAPEPAAEAAPINPRSNQALYFTAGPQASTRQSSIPPTAAMPPEVRGGPRGIALAMTECQVVQIAGNTDRVEIGSEGGRRSVVLTYMSGDRPGIYRFLDGRLVTMQRVEVPAAPKKPARPAKTTKAKPRT